MSDLRIIRMPPGKTLQDTFIRALLRRGETEVKTKSLRYRKFTRKPYATEQSKFYFVGAGGSLRVGTDREHSIPVADTMRIQLIKEGQCTTASG